MALGSLFVIYAFLLTRKVIKVNRRIDNEWIVMQTIIIQKCSEEAEKVNENSSTQEESEPETT